LFGDIVGFTAWSSVREPTQVFTLLETVYHAFDDIARRRRVFKVETVGDCYVAVCGLPDPRKDHAVTMCRFARDCMFRMWALVKKLETTLGPDTSDLTMRMGLHSGPVTAGVLRGERSRFQLFGDTVNTAARMEHNGMKSKIQISDTTANILLASGKRSWVTLREDKIIAKGKGEMQTYWLELGGGSTNAPPEATTGFTSYTMDVCDQIKKMVNDVESSHNGPEDSPVAETRKELKPVCSDKVLRLVGWNVEVLLRLIKQIVARRQASIRRSKSLPVASEETVTQGIFGTDMVLDEVKEIIELPQFDAKAAKNQLDIDSIELDARVPMQLEEYVMTIGSGYRENPFHNFEHAAHVTMSVVKLLSRIVAPSQHYSEEGCSTARPDDASSLHDHTYGITSDPLTQFSCVLSALIHDLDHPGVPNAQLVKESTPLAEHYKYKSVAEQNSVDMAWTLLMQPRYKELRAAIYNTECELRRFRQLVVNSVMATDIVDKELKNLRNARWDKAFSQDDDAKLENVHDQINRKATIVIEHLIQASDVAHTMQHWHIYRKWNERFFTECYQAYKTGRAETDPSINWYQGEIGFFDFYIIPLAKKLKNCGVFGVSCDEYLNYALKNRKEWEERGQDIVHEMTERVKGSL
jgi:class 3 adenylate cyclase